MHKRCIHANENHTVLMKFFYGFHSVFCWLKLEETEEEKADNNY